MDDQFIGKVLAEKYRIDELMREDALGNLYSGTHLLMEKTVCVKILPSSLAGDEKIVNSFANEARTVSRISHPNVLSVTDYGSDEDGTVFIVFEDATGETLKDILKRIGKLSLKRANRVIQEIESALTIAHNNGIIHQNLRTENILVQPIGNNAEAIKILNFGTAPFDINDLDYPFEKAYYLSPEQSTAAGKTDVRSDIYSLGVILYEMLAGEVPLNAPTTTDLLLKHLQEMPPPITAFREDLPIEIDDILLKALAKNPEIRYQTANEFAEELDKVSLLAKDTDETETMFIPAVSTVLPTNTTAIATEQPQNNLWKTAFIVLAGIVLLGGSFVYLTSGKQTNPSVTNQFDANGMPVQPVNPATGTTEQGLANMNDYNPNLYSNANTGVTDGGGTYNPYWDQGKLPPGAQQPNYGPPMGSDPGYVPPSNSGPIVYVDPANGSIFMPKEIQVMPANSSNSTVNNQPNQKKGSNSSVNTTATPANGAKPATTPPPANTATNTAPPTEVKQTPMPKGKQPKATPTPKPAATPTSSNEKRPASGKEQDANQF